MSAVIRWEEPPTTTSARPGLGVGKSIHAQLAEELRGRPGVWALVYEGHGGRASTLATHIRMGHVICFSPAGEFDATTRRVDGETRVYAVYLGDLS